MCDWWLHLYSLISSRLGASIGWYWRTSIDFPTFLWHISKSRESVVNKIQNAEKKGYSATAKMSLMNPDPAWKLVYRDRASVTTIFCAMFSSPTTYLPSSLRPPINIAHSRYVRDALSVRPGDRFLKKSDATHPRAGGRWVADRFLWKNLHNTSRWQIT